MREAGSVFPLRYDFRRASAVGMVSLAEGDKNLLDPALGELKRALVKDTASPELLALTISVELALDRDQDAKAHYQIFKQVARKSHLLSVHE